MHRRILPALVFPRDSELESMDWIGESHRPASRTLAVEIKGATCQSLRRLGYLHHAARMMNRPRRLDQNRLPINTHRDHLFRKRRSLTHLPTVCFRHIRNLHQHAVLLSAHRRRLLLLFPSICPHERTCRPRRQLRPQKLADCEADGS